MQCAARTLTPAPEKSILKTQQVLSIYTLWLWDLPLLSPETLVTSSHSASFIWDPPPQSVLHTVSTRIFWRHHILSLVQAAAFLWYPWNKTVVIWYRGVISPKSASSPFGQLFFLLFPVNRCTQGPTFSIWECPHQPSLLPRLYSISQVTLVKPAFTSGGLSQRGWPHLPSRVTFSDVTLSLYSKSVMAD